MGDEKEKQDWQKGAEARREAERDFEKDPLGEIVGEVLLGDWRTWGESETFKAAYRGESLESILKRREENSSSYRDYSPDDEEYNEDDGWYDEDEEDEDDSSSVNNHIQVDHYIPIPTPGQIQLQQPTAIYPDVGCPKSTQRIEVRHGSGWVVFGRLLQILPLFGLALLMGFWENYRLNGPYENIGLPLVYTVFGAALLVAAIERSAGWGFLIGCVVTAGSVFGLSLHPETSPYLTPGQAIVNGFSFALLSLFVSWLFGKIFEDSNHSGCLSTILGFLLLGLLVWQFSALPLEGVRTSIKFPSGISANLEKVHVAVAALLSRNKPIPIEPTAVSTAKPIVKIENNTQGASTSNSYVVVKGDTLWGIAVKLYGDGSRWVEIAQANSLTNPQLIHTGDILKLPR